MFAFVTSERFNLLEAKDRDRLEMLAKLDEFKAGQEISASGKPVEWLCLIAAGGVDVRAKTKSGEVTLVELGPGDIFGEVPITLGMPFPAGYRAAEASRIMRIEAHDYHATAVTAPDIAVKVGEIARGRIGGCLNGDGPVARPGLAVIGAALDPRGPGAVAFD